MPNFDDERIQAVLKGRRAIRVMPFPDAEGVNFGIRILTEEEIDAAKYEATVYLKELAKKRNIDPGELVLLEPEFLDREIQRQVVWRSFVDADYKNKSDPPPFFPEPDNVRSLDSVLVETLYQCYVEHMNYVNPLRSADEKEVAELVEALGKGPNALVSLGLYDAPTLRKLVHTLVAHISALPTSN